jgi:hypothetical protein
MDEMEFNDLYTKVLNAIVKWLKIDKVRHSRKHRTIF